MSDELKDIAKFIAYMEQASAAFRDRGDKVGVSMGDLVHLATFAYIGSVATIAALCDGENAQFRPELDAYLASLIEQEELAMARSMPPDSKVDPREALARMACTCKQIVDDRFSEFRRPLEESTDEAEEDEAEE